jgi:hypothetical protein
MDQNYEEFKASTHIKIKYKTENSPKEAILIAMIASYSSSPD